MKHKVIIEIISFLLTLLFVYAAAAKFLDVTNFRHQLSLSPFIGGFAGTIAIVLPLVELATAALLTIKNTRFYGLLASLLLLMLFTGYIAAMLLSGVHLPCSCGGVISSLSWKEHLIFNLFFLAITIVAFVTENKERKYNRQKERSI
ncbi:MAG TPA: MauE/DoxX family redox-associated membrane protein [Hanamia sp.]|nr:MauE/DoxX family redox-associated membrane protein [Hanamia sp.]